MCVCVYACAVQYRVQASFLKSLLPPLERDVTLVTQGRCVCVPDKQLCLCAIESSAFVAEMHTYPRTHAHTRMRIPLPPPPSLCLACSLARAARARARARSLPHCQCFPLSRLHSLSLNEICVHICTCMFSLLTYYSHTYMHTYMHACMYTYMHAYIRT